MDKEVYFIVGAMLCVLIAVAFVSLFRGHGLMSKFSALFTMGVAITVLVFGHSHYKREHTFQGRLENLGRRLVGFFD